MRKATFLSLIIIAVSIVPLSGQKLLNSPYGRFGIGNLETTGSFRSLGMGGTSVASSNNIYLSFTNPASFSAIDTNSFVFDIGADYTMASLAEGDTKYFTDDFNFDHLVIGFPIMKGWGFSAGIFPYSNAYYNMSQVVEEGDPGYDPLTGSYSNIHEGSGGFSTLYAGTGFKPIKNLAIGVNLTVLFGQIERFNHLVFLEDVNQFNNRSSEKLTLNGLNFDFGALYTQPLKNDYYFNAGFSFTSSRTYNTEFESLRLRYNSYSGTEYSPDTLSYITLDGENTTLPSSFRFGIALGKKDKFTATADYHLTQWANAILPGGAADLRNIESIRVGFEYIPNKYSNYNFLDRVEYRIGGHTTDNYLIFNDAGLKEFGITFGIGLQMRRSMSRTNIYFDLTRRDGSDIPGLFNETYFSMGVSLNLYDYWFIKRKYN